MTSLKFKTLTPLWTGDYNGRCESLKSTSIIGSLRWWFEAIIRGFGYYACDPNSELSCPENDIYYCHNCIVFGSTGIKRAFNLKIKEERLINSYTGGKAINIRPKHRNRGWYLGNGLIGSFNLELLPIILKFDLSLVQIVLEIASNWGAIGSKTQLGYGVLEIENKNSINVKEVKENFERIIKDRLKLIKGKLRTLDNHLPNLRDFFFSKIEFEMKNNNWWEEIDGFNINYKKQLEEWYKKSKSYPIVPTIKNWLRFNNSGKKIIPNSNWNLNNYLYGRSKTSASKINISNAYQVGEKQWEFRIWGWIPEKNHFDREGFLNNLKSCLNNTNEDNEIPWKVLLGSNVTNFNLIAWREFNSERDTLNKYKEIEDYIDSLL